MGNLPIHNQVWDDNFMAFARASPQALGVKSHDGDYPITTWLKTHNLSKGRGVYLNSALQLMENEKLELQNENSSTKEALAQVQRDLEFQTKMTKEARKIEKEFRSTLLDPENEAAASIPTLETFAEKSQDAPRSHQGEVGTNEQAFSRANHVSFLYQRPQCVEGVVDGLHRDARVGAFESGRGERCGSSIWKRQQAWLGDGWNYERK